MQMSALARILGRRGGRARSRRLAPAAKRRIASLGGQARRQSLEAALRIAANFRYAEAMEQLRGGSPPVRRLKRFDGRLPGLYPEQS
jgi:hypothetical protein